MVKQTLDLYRFHGLEMAELRCRSLTGVTSVNTETLSLTLVSMETVPGRAM